jgi:hypothetical protein
VDDGTVLVVKALLDVDREVEVDAGTSLVVEELLIDDSEVGSIVEDSEEDVVPAGDVVVVTVSVEVVTFVPVVVAGSRVVVLEVVWTDVDGVQGLVDVVVTDAGSLLVVVVDVENPESLTQFSTFTESRSAFIQAVNPVVSLLMASEEHLATPASLRGESFSLNETMATLLARE